MTNYSDNANPIPHSKSHRRAPYRVRCDGVAAHRQQPQEGKLESDPNVAVAAGRRPAKEHG
eukprot:12192501-Prorocentrum_lima.AAC.1